MTAITPATPTTGTGPQRAIAGLMGAGLTPTQIARALKAPTGAIISLATWDDTPLTADDRERVMSLTPQEVARANRLIDGVELADHLRGLVRQGCQPTDIDEALGLDRGSAARAMSCPGAWAPSDGIGRAMSLTIDQIPHPRVLAALTLNRIRSLSSMGWSRDDIEALTGPGLPQEGDAYCPRATAVAVLAFWDAHSDRLNPAGRRLAARSRPRWRTPADWDPPADLFTPPSGQREGWRLTTPARPRPINRAKE